MQSLAAMLVLAGTGVLVVLAETDSRWPAVLGWLLIAAGVLAFLGVFVIGLFRSHARRKLQGFFAEGVALRDKALSLESDEQVGDWIAEYEQWHLRVRDFLRTRALRRLSQYDDPLSRLASPISTRAVNEAHSRHYSIFSERLVRVQQVIQQLSD